MLAAPDTAAGPRRLTQQFRQQPPDIPRKSNIVTMTAVIGKDKIPFLQLPREGKRRKFLPHAGMHGAIELSQREKIQEFLFHLPDAERLANDPVIYGYSIIYHAVPLNAENTIQRIYKTKMTLKRFPRAIIPGKPAPIWRIPAGQPAVI